MRRTHLLIFLATALVGWYAAKMIPRQAPPVPAVGAPAAEEEAAKPTVEQQLAGKNSHERATFKGQEVAKVDAAQTVTGTLFPGSFQIVSLASIDGGVQALIRAWDRQGHPIGFGADGSVEIERVRIYNPPILVPDINGAHKREWVDELTGEAHVLRYREDLKSALLQVLDHTLSVKHELSTKGTIVAGKIGNTTSTFYPDANIELASVDGYTGQDYTTTGTGWAATRDAADGNTADDSSATISLFTNESGGAGPDAYNIKRAFHLFDTSALGASAVISSATMSLWGTSIGDSDNDGNDYINIYTTSPALNIALISQDFDQIGTVAQATAQDITGLSTGAYTDWTLNATGLGNISSTGVTKFGAREGHDVANDPLAQNGTNRFDHASADTLGTTNDPKLVVESTVASTVPPANNSAIIFE